MLGLKKHETLKIPHLLLISGNGRNVGKTHLACKIIQYFSQKREVIGMKISPHFHTVRQENIILKNEKYVIVDEKEFSAKDSSLMLQAGAKKVFFIMSMQESLKDVVDELIKILPNKLIVCESGGLRKFVKPGIFLFVKRTGDEIVKPELLNYSPVIVNNSGFDFDFDIHNLEFEQNKFIQLKNQDATI